MTLAIFTLNVATKVNELKVLVFDKPSLNSMDAAPEPPSKDLRRLGVQVATL